MQHDDLKDIMRNARVDLTGHLSGEFSPEDWQAILVKAQAQLSERVERGLTVNEAWQQVVRDFAVHGQWGYEADYVRPKVVKKKANLGVSFIWLAFMTLTVTKMAVVWLGQIYSRSDEPQDGWIFLAVVLLVVANFGYFLWRHRNHQD